LVVLVVLPLLVVLLDHLLEVVVMLPDLPLEELGVQAEVPARTMLWCIYLLPCIDQVLLVNSFS
jgi:sorbitol-specific phosphotransferase system component IIC